jgi:thiol-disulfide isomerase/thioredoxin
MKRRHVLMAGAAAGAAAAGMGWQLWRERSSAGSGGALAPNAGGVTHAPEAFWALKLPRPDGSELALASLRGRPLVLNFWATWCPPCIKEMPELDQFHQAYAARGWQVLGLAVDRTEPVRDFLARHPVGFAIALTGLDGTELARTLGNPQGLLPFTVVFDAKGRIVHRKLGQTSMAQLAGWADAM